jgi:methylmalonyl-CoA mutase
MRAARMLWAKLIKEFDPKNPKSLSLRTHSQTSGWSLTAQDVFNNVIRTCIEAMAATQGHTQSLHTNALDEALALPTDFSARIARNTQLFLQQEAGTCQVIDPWGGSYYVERLTLTLPQRPGRTSGGRRNGRHGQGHCRRAAETAHRGSRRRTQARIDSGSRRSSASTSTSRTKRSRDRLFSRSTMPPCATSNFDKLARLRASVAESEVDEKLDALTKRCRTGEGNLLALRRDAARAKATVGEISCRTWKRSGPSPRPRSRSMKGVYRRRPASHVRRPIQKAQGARRSLHRRNDGRAQSILVAKMGQDGHDRGQKVIASAFCRPWLRCRDRPAVPDAGRSAAKQAIESEVT